MRVVYAMEMQTWVLLEEKHPGGVQFLPQHVLLPENMYAREIDGWDLVRVARGDTVRRSARMPCIGVNELLLAWVGVIE